MFKNVNVLQLGPTDLSLQYTLDPCVLWFYEDDLKECDIRIFDVVILTRSITEEEKYHLFKKTKAYCLFVLKDIVMNSATTWICRSKMAKTLSEEQIITFLQGTVQDYYDGSYGEKFVSNHLSVNDGFQGEIQWNGFTDLTLKGNFGNSFQQIAYWRYNIPIANDQTLEFWLEYEKIGNVEIELKIVKFISGSLNTLEDEWIFSEDELKKIITITNTKNQGSLFVSIMAKGEGSLKIIALHDRFSRRGKGTFLPGGVRWVTKKREEVFFYFDPGDLKPPLNVYFSGYKTQEGFEGYYLMKKLGAPFLLISESRLEGGSFYLGDEDYEKMIIQGIQNYLDVLGFTSNQMVMSGLSMGTFGALYYGCDFQPYSILLGKPLASIGDIAQNERIQRPGVFPTSLDVVWKQYRNIDNQSIEALNLKFWNKFDSVEWKHTKFAISYMIEDDYDNTAYATLLKHIQNDEVEIYSKGLHGRHNDNTNGIVNWFVSRYKYILNECFEREFEDE